MWTTISSARALLAFGGNIGDVPATFTQAIDYLQSIGAVQGEISAAPLYISRSLLNDEQDDYINTVYACDTPHSPLNLLSKLKDTEAHFGRPSDHGHWQARTLDIDIIDYNGEVIEAEGLSIPHPRMQERDFVLLPLRELCPEYVHPRSGKSIDDMIAELQDSLTHMFPLKG